MECIAKLYLISQYVTTKLSKAVKHWSNNVNWGYDTYLHNMSYGATVGASAANTTLIQPGAKLPVRKNAIAYTSKNQQKWKLEN